MDINSNLRKIAVSLLACFAAFVVVAGTGSAQTQPAAKAQDPAAAAPAAAGTATLTVRISGIRSTTGKIGVVLYGDGQGFPLDPSQSVAVKRVDIDPKTLTATAVFEKLPQGVYAVTVLHDEKLIGKMEFDSQGIPLEGYGISNNPDSSSGPPTFDESKFSVNQAEQAIDIAMYYWPSAA